MWSLKRDEILLLFDVDGTLTPPRANIDPEFEEFLYSQIKPRATIGIVSGASLEQMCNQLNGRKILLEFDYVFSENGTVQFANGVEVGRQSIQEHLGEELLQRFTNRALRYLSELVLPVKRGSFIDFRNGMMNISPMGRYYTSAERSAFVEYNKEHQITKKMIATLKEEFGDYLSFSTGGQISFDLYPKGWDKTYCLPLVTTGTNFKEIHFFGDSTEPGGNDYEIFIDPRTISHRVSSTKDTKIFLTELFKLQN